MKLLVRKARKGDKAAFKQLMEEQEISLYKIAKSKSGHRTLNLFPTAELCFKKLKQQQEENREFFGDTYCDTQGYIFTHEDGHPYRPDFISKKFCVR